MANAEHLEILEQGVEVWNKWREENKSLKNPDLSGIHLSDKIFHGINLKGVNLSDAVLNRCDIEDADLTYTNFAYSDLRGVSFQKSMMLKTNFLGAILSVTNFTDAHLQAAIFNNSNLENSDLSYTNLNGASFIKSNLKSVLFTKSHLADTNFTNANLNGANFIRAIVKRVNLSGVNLSRVKFIDTSIVESNLSRAILIGTEMKNSNLIDSRIYGISVWDLKSENSVQKDLIISKEGEPNLTVDNLEVAQFLYLLLDNKKFRDVIETVTSKSVLILGRFTDERKKVLDAIRDELRNRNFLPILFDFEKPATRDLTETISILAKLSRFVIVDLTDPNSVPHELATIVPVSRSLPFASIMLKGQKPYSLFRDFSSYYWVLPTFEYEDEGHLISTLSTGVVEPAERKVQEIRSKMK